MRMIKLHTVYICYLDDIKITAILHNCIEYFKRPNPTLYIEIGMQHGMIGMQHGMIGMQHGMSGVQHVVR